MNQMKKYGLWRWSSGLALGLLAAVMTSCGTSTKQNQVVDYDVKLGKVPMQAKLESDDYFVWGASLVKGEDGLYHMFYSRWPRKYDWAWVTDSEIAHATSKSPFGPWKFSDVTLSRRGDEYWDGWCTHNPTIHKFDGKYYLYYMGNRGDKKIMKDQNNPKWDTRINWVHRNNQRIGVAVADSPNGPWKRFDKPVMDISPDSTAMDHLMTSNPSVCKGPNGEYLMVYKGVGLEYPLPNGGPVVHCVAKATSPTGPFKKYPNPVFTFPGERFPAEDPYIWYADGKYRAIVKRIEEGHKEFVDKKGKNRKRKIRKFSLWHYESKNGIDWNPAKEHMVSDLEITWENGRYDKLAHLERPQLYIEDGKVVALLCAADSLVGDDKRRVPFNVQIPVVLKKTTVEK